MSAIPNGYITSVIGYNLKAGNFSTPAQTLPVQVALLGEPNTAIEPGVDETESKLVLTKKEMGELSGFGSLPHLMFEYLQYLRVPIRWYPQKYDTVTPPTATIHSLTITGTSTIRTTHNLVVNGRAYSILIEEGDSEAEITPRILDAINGNIDAPVTATNALPGVDFTTKWKGKTSAGLRVRIETGKEASNVSYSFSIVAGTGTPTDVEDSLNRFGSTWNTLVVNPYGEDIFSTLELFNGVADSETPIGRWDPLIGMPFLALFGSNDSDKDDIALITDTSARKSQMTNVACSTPNAESFPCEGAASGALKYGTIANETPHKGLVNNYFPLLPAPFGGVGDMGDAKGRNAIALLGHSTSEYVNGAYKVKDFITTFHPDGDTSPKFREARDVMVDMNILYYIKLIMERDIQGKVTTLDTSIVNVVDMISVVDVKAIISNAIRNLAGLGFIATPDFSIENMTVTLNPQYRFNISFPYQRTAEIKQVGADAIVDFFTVI